MFPDAGTGHYQVLTAMLAPALLMAATGSLLISANNRLARVVDRLRAIIAARGEATDAELRGSLDRQIVQHRRRSHYVLRACTLLYVALGAFVATSLSLAVDAFTGFALGLLPASFALFGVVTLLVASLFMGLEVHLAINSLNEECDLQLRQQGHGTAS